MKQGRTWIALLIAACFAAVCAGALADGFAYWTEETGSVYFNQAYNREYYSNRYEEGPRSTNYHDTKVVRVISKSASIWLEPRTNSKRLGTVYNGDEVEIIRSENGGPYEQNGFYRVSHQGQAGWINQAYCVFSPFEIILMEPNVPAYCAPDTYSKKVGSLNKLTRYTVLGTFGDFYIVNLRQAAAFIPMSVRHYDTTFESRFLPAYGDKNGVVTSKTTLRTGPGDWYSSVEEVKAGYTFTCVGEIDGWYMLAYSSKNTDGTVLVYVRDYDVEVSGYYSDANG